MIMESHKDTAFPIFYDVEPSEVRKQNGAVGEAFARHAGKEDAEKWRKALEEASNQSGWDVRNTENGHEARVIRLIVDFISLQSRSINIEDDVNLIGMEHRMKDLDSLLEIGSNDVRMIGIKGMGGAGKTTLARTIFDSLCIHFEAKSFVENVREVSKASSSGLQSLQQKVLSHVLKDHDITLESDHDGKRLMKMRLRSKKVLLVLDDVDCIEQLEALAGAPDWFKPGSRIIITTRNAEVLLAHNVKFIHDVSLLSSEEAVHLFSRHAFGSYSPKLGYETLSREAARYAAGLPLTLRVLGSSLCGKDELEWRDVLKRLNTIPLAKTLERLELSYESLEDDYKEIFLDVTCFMKGLSKDFAIEMLETSGFHARIGLRVLEQRSLISLKTSYIEMHDHIEELGKNIVCRDHPHKRSRMWVQEEIEDVLANNMGSEATRWVQFSLTPQIVLQNLLNMNKLRNLHVNYSADGRIDVVLPNSLCYLSWGNYCNQFLPKTFLASNLVVLNMVNGRLQQLWRPGNNKKLTKLRFLDLRWSKIRTLDLGMTPNLERLNLSECTDLKELHVPNGRQLKRLVGLDLSWCKRMKSSISFIKQLESLEILRLRGLSLSEFPDIIPGYSDSTLLELDFGHNNIKELPPSLGNLHKLVRLDLSYCRKLKSLPRSLYSLQHLQTLNLEDCVIEEMSEELGELRYLVNLNLSYTRVREIPSSICRLKNLKSLNLLVCRQIESLPDELGDVECLEELRVTGSSVNIPDSIFMLKHVKVLCLSGLKGDLPEDVSQLESLVELDLYWSNIRNLPSSISKLKHLESLDLSYTAIDHLPEEVVQLESLEVLRLNGCNIRSIPSIIGMLKQLRDLYLGNCKLLEELPDELGDIESLESLDIGGSGIRHLPRSIGMLKQLRGLYLGGCKLLEELPDELGNIESLEYLDIDGSGISHLPRNIGMLKQLRVLHLRNCELLEELPDELGNIESLERLNIEGSGISRLPQSISLLEMRGGLKVVRNYNDNMRRRKTFLSSIIDLFKYLKFCFSCT